MSLLIKNAIIVNSDSISKEPQDIFLVDGKIKKIASKISDQAEQVIDAKRNLVMPGLIDIHVHFREPGQEHKETIETGSQSAAKGGFTTVMCMPNTRPVLDNAMLIEGIYREAKRVGLVNVIPIGSITRAQKDEELVDMFELKKAGCLALSDDGKSVVNSQLMRRALEYAKMVDILLIQHCEDPLISADGAMNEGEVSTKLGIKGDPYISESIIVARDIELAHYLGTKIHFAHMSNRRSVELIRMAKSQGIQVTAEVCPHHFALTENAVESFDTRTKMNPPLRTQDDIEAMKEGLKDGTIDCIVTDHAPHTAEEKEVDYEAAPFGIVGLETSVGITIKELIKPGILSWMDMVRCMSTKPAEIIGLPNKGVIKEGMDADITIIDPESTWTFTEESILSKSKNTPFIGDSYQGEVMATICGGKLSYLAAVFAKQKSA